MIAVVGLEEALVLGLEHVVEFLAQPKLELIDDRLGLDAREHHADDLHEHGRCG